MIVVDTRGRACPEPLIMAKKAISQAPKGEMIDILSDNDTARCNLLAYLSELGLTPSEMTDEQGIYHIFTGDVPTCGVPKAKKGGYVVVLRSETMGDGDDQLGAILMRSCINSLAELDELPHTIIMYNAGVKLAMQGRDTAQSLTELENKGVQIIVCGTCVDYFEIKQSIAVGTISNMYRINDILSHATHVVYP